MEVENKEYKKILVTYYDPNNTIFKSTNKDKASYTVYMCCNHEKCEAFKQGKCTLRNGLSTGYCPYGKMVRNQGPTKRAKSCLSFLIQAKEECKDTLTSHLDPCDKLCKIGDYIYLNLSYLDNYVNPIVEKLGIVKQQFLPKEKFSVETIKTLLDYRPLALFGGEITSYREKELPPFIYELQAQYPLIYQEVKKAGGSLPDKKDLSFLLGKKAFVKTLSPGRVKIGIKYWEWDGKKLTGIGKDIIGSGLNEEKIVMYPNENTKCIVCEERTIGDNTRFA